MKYIHYFESVSDYNTARSDNYEEPWVSLTEESEIFDVDYNKTEEEKRQEKLQIPLTFEITSDGFVNWKASNTANTKTIEYKLNDGDWTEITSTTGGTQISVVSGDTVQFRGSNDSYATSSNYNTFSGTTCGFKVKGNIMSLIYKDNYATMTSFPNDSSYNFESLFSHNSGLTDASELILPASTLAQDCYNSMFINCTDLTTTPELPATTLTGNCYFKMFEGCASLVNAPELPATTLARYCYYGMFKGCTSLTTSPELPVTTLIYGCYQQMFQGCTSLTTVSVLPATTLVEFCYRWMFSGCTSLNYIKCLATDISASNCTSNWVNGVASTGTFVKDASMTSWPTGTSGIPNGWTVQDA